MSIEPVLFPRDMRALEKLIEAMIEARAVRNSSGPHVSEVLERLRIARDVAWRNLTGGPER